MSAAFGCSVVTERLVASRAIAVYILSQNGRYQLQNVTHDAGQEIAGEWVEVKQGSRMEPSMILPDFMAEAFAAALADTIPPSSSMQRHLDDAVKVRDVLLDLVAKVVRDGA